jgi:hypothetical protein
MCKEIKTPIYEKSCGQHVKFLYNNLTGRIKVNSKYNNEIKSIVSNQMSIGN